MPTSYNQIAGKSIERLAALSDGLFAIAMTLLILELRAPTADSIRSEVELWHALVALSAQLIMYLIGFLTLGIFWIGQQSQLSQFAHADRNLTWIHIGFLAAVALMPFSTALLAHHLPRRPVRLLAQHAAARHRSLWLVGLCQLRRSVEVGRVGGDLAHHQNSHPCVSGTLHRLRAPFCHQYLLEHRLSFAAPALFRALVGNPSPASDPPTICWRPKTLGEIARRRSAHSRKAFALADMGTCTANVRFGG